MSLLFLSAKLFRLCLPLDNILVRLLTFPDDSLYKVYQHSIDVNGFRVELVNNTVVIHSSIAFDNEYASYLRIPIISWEQNQNIRSILGYYIVSNDGSLKIWNRRFSFGKSQMPRIFRSGAVVGIAIRFVTPFLSTAIAFRNEHETDYNSTVFMTDRLVSSRNTISHQSSFGGHFVCFESNDSASYRELSNTYIRFSRTLSCLRQDDTKAYELGLYFLFFT